METGFARKLMTLLFHFPWSASIHCSSFLSPHHSHPAQPASKPANLSPLLLAHSISHLKLSFTCSGTQRTFLYFLAFFSPHFKFRVRALLSLLPAQYDHCHISRDSKYTFPSPPVHLSTSTHGRYPWSNLFTADNNLSREESCVGKTIHLDRAHIEWPHPSRAEWRHSIHPISYMSTAPNKTATLFECRRCMHSEWCS